MSDALWVPKMPRREVREVALRIRPVIMVKNTGYCYPHIDPRDTEMIFNQSYLEKLGYQFFNEPKLAPELVLIKTIKTYHTYAEPDFFVPSIAEVITQIPSDLMEQVTEFEVVPDEDNWEAPAFEEGYHSASTKLFRRVEPES